MPCGRGCFDRVKYFEGENLKKNFYKAKFSRRDSDISLLEARLDAFEKFESALTKLFSLSGKRPLFIYDGRPDMEFGRQLCDFAEVIDLIPGRSLLRLPEIRKISVQKGERLKVHAFFKNSLPSEAELQIFAFKKKHPEVTMIYSRYQGKLGLIYEPGKIKRVEKNNELKERGVHV